MHIYLRNTVLPNDRIKIRSDMWYFVRSAVLREILFLQYNAVTENCVRNIEGVIK